VLMVVVDLQTLKVASRGAIQIFTSITQELHGYGKYQNYLVDCSLLYYSNNRVAVIPQL